MGVGYKRSASRSKMDAVRAVCKQSIVMVDESCRLSKLRSALCSLGVPTGGWSKMISGGPGGCTSIEGTGED